MVISIVGKSGLDPGEVRIRKTNENESFIKRRKGEQMTSKPMSSSYIGISLLDTWILGKRCPALRWRNVELREPVVMML